jgi:hypothetical protein
MNQLSLVMCPCKHNTKCPMLMRVGTKWLGMTFMVMMNFIESSVVR